MRAHTILVVDDNPNNLKVVMSHLEAYSYDLYTALNGEAALDRARKVKPALILLDVQMPGIDGFEVCKRLKANPQTASIPVIFMTALTETRDKVRGFEVGAVDYVTKPIEASELLARVQAHLQLRGLQVNLEARVAERTAEQAQLLEVVRLQNDQLRRFTRDWVQRQEHRDQGLEVLRTHLAQALALVGESPAVRAHLENALALLAPEPAAEPGRGVDKADLMGDNPMVQLSQREYEVLQMTASGCANKEIAHTLEIAPSTVSTYRARIMEKLDVEDLASLVRLAAEHGIIS